MSRASYFKGPDESASLLGQLLHDLEPIEFDVMDMDCVVWKSERRCLRYFEEKLPGEKVSAGQRRNLGLLALFIQLAVGMRLIGDGGVYLVRFDTGDVHEFDQENSTITVAEVESTPFTFSYGELMVGTWSQFRPLFTGKALVP